MSFPFRQLTTAAALCIGMALPASADSDSGAYLAARQAAALHDFTAAAQYLTSALVRDPSHAGLLEQMVVTQISLGEVGKAVPVARKMLADGLESQVARMAAAAGLVQQEDYDTLVTRIDGGQGIGPLVDGLMKGWAEIGRGDMTKALAGFDAVSKERGLTGFALYHKALALASVGDFEGAEAVFAAPETQAVGATRRGAISRIEVLSQLDRNEDAVALLDAVFIGELDPGLRIMRARLAAGEPVPFTHVTGVKDGMAEVFYSIAGALKSEANPEYTLLYSRLAEELRPEHVDAVLLSAALLEELERYELATQAYKSVPADHTAFHAAELGRAEALRRSGKIEAAIEVLEQLSRTHADMPVIHSTLGDVLRHQERYAEAVAAYDRALDRYDEKDATLWFVYYARGITNERLDRWEQSEADFRKALKLNPNQPQVLNYLGYSLVEKQVKLDEALNMIETAVAKRPESGYIVDSLGWVLYRLGRYDEAVGHMERATELMPVDPIVNDHLGDVYWAVGRKLEAEFQWLRALSFAPEEKDADRIRRKLDVGLDQVLADEGAAPLKIANDGG